MRSPTKCLGIAVLLCLIAGCHKHPSPNALFEAVRQGDLNRVQSLVNSGGMDIRDPNVGSAALDWAATMGHLAIAKILLAHGAEVNAMNREGRTPLDYAYNSLPSLVETLRVAGAEEGRVLRKRK